MSGKLQWWKRKKILLLNHDNEMLTAERFRGKIEKVPRDAQKILNLGLKYKTTDVSSTAQSMEYMFQGGHSKTLVNKRWDHVPERRLHPLQNDWLNQPQPSAEHSEPKGWYADFNVSIR